MPGFQAIVNIECIYGVENKLEFTIVFRKAHAQVGLFDLLDEDVFLVEEEYNGSSSEVAVVADTVEQVEALVHAVL